MVKSRELAKEILDILAQDKGIGFSLVKLYEQLDKNGCKTDSATLTTTLKNFIQKTKSGAWRSMAFQPKLTMAFGSC